MYIQYRFYCHSIFVIETVKAASICTSTCYLTFNLFCVALLLSLMYKSLDKLHNACKIIKFQFEPLEVAISVGKQFYYLG